MSLFPVITAVCRLGRNLSWGLGLLAFLGFWVALPARADNPGAGATAYVGDCRSCHGASPLTSNTSKIYNGRNARALLDAAFTNVGDMRSLRSAYPSGGAALADMAAYLGNNPTSLSFTATTLGSTSAARTITVYASLKSGHALSAMSFTATGDFARSGGTCGSTLAVGGNCTVGVVFTPTAAGTRTGSLAFSHGGTLTPITFSLSGSGSSMSAPAASLSPGSLSFSSTAIGSTSTSQNLTVSNTGNAALTLSALSFTSADFASAGGDCVVPGSLAAGSSCTLAVAFAPQAGAAGARNGSLSLTHNASGSPGTVALSGNAAAAPTAAASLTASLAFGSVNVGSTSSTQTATLSNTGTAALSLTSITVAGADFARSGGTCAAGGSVAAGSSCTVGLQFAPTATGTRSGTLTVNHNASGGSSSTALSGSGVALTPVIGLSPTSLSFSQQVGTASAEQIITLSNSGTAPLLLGAVSISGTQAAEFALGSSSTCAAQGSVAAGSSCQWRIAFTPGATGTRSASLGISHNASGSPSSVALNGNATATPQSALSLSASSLVFAAQVLNLASAPQTVVVSNSGSAALTLSSLTLTGAAATDFTRSGSCVVNGSVAPGSSCTVSLAFTPAATGTRTATLSIGSNASGGVAALSLSGSGVAAAAAAVALSPAALNFGNQTVGVGSAPTTVTLSNTGTAALVLSGLSASSGWVVSHSCGSSVAVGASCAVQLVFTPAATGPMSGSLSLTSNAPGSPHAVALSGTGVASVPVLAWVPALSALDFGDATVGGQPVVRSLSLQNQGPGSASLLQWTLAGAQAADFSLSSGTSCSPGLVLAQGASCTLQLSFQPGAAGARQASLGLNSTASLPQAITLSGNGTAAAVAAIAAAPTALQFSVQVPAAPQAQTFSLQSTGNGVLHVTAWRVASGSFALAPAASSGCPQPPFDLLPGQACSLTVSWTSADEGDESGAVEIDSNAAASPLSLALQATRTPVATAAAAPMSNVGAGGCAIARGDSLFDPTLWLTLMLALGVIALRRTGREGDLPGGRVAARVTPPTAVTPAVPTPSSAADDSPFKEPPAP